MEANRAFARVLAAESKQDPVFLIQDYHLTLVPRMLRELVPEARILHFSHTPFAGRTYLRTLPVEIRSAMLRGMLGADVVGFQGRQWGENFLLSARELEDVHVDIRAHRADLDGREVQVRSFPVAVGAFEIREASQTDRAKRLRRGSRRSEAIGVCSSGSTDSSRRRTSSAGFLAFELFLQKHPEWRGEVVFLALLSPSREEVPAYRDYRADCRSTADRINAAFGKEDWTPIVVKVQEDFTYAVAAYDSYDAMVVNPVHDGMNLVAMEGPIVNSRGGVLILSSQRRGVRSPGAPRARDQPVRSVRDRRRDPRGLADARRGADAPRRGMQRSALAHTPATWLAAQLRAIDEVRPSSE